jgi:transcriptional regulator with PAS, ATPase and Fis domain
LFAQHIHAWSGRPGALVDVNCAALPDTLLESELFGHAAGAFTGARRAKPGLIESADGQSCFLDEISSLTLSLQAKLLRALEMQEIRRVGEVVKRRVDVRFIAAAQDDLGARIREGAFRQDLYQRLAGVVVRIPPLAQRLEDLLPLAEHFAIRVGRRLAPDAERVLLAHTWPGNVRELGMVIERAACFDGGEVLTGSVVRDAIAAGAPVPAGDARGGSRVINGGSLRGDRPGLSRLLRRFGGRVAAAAREAGVPRSTFRHWLHEVGLAGAGLSGRPARPEPKLATDGLQTGQ